MTISSYLRYCLTGLLFAAPVFGCWAADIDWNAAITKMWISPITNRLNLVGPWDSQRPLRGALCPPGETRQIWLDFDGHKLPVGNHSLWLVLTAKVDRQPFVDAFGKTNDPLPKVQLDAREKELFVTTNVFSPERRKFLNGLALSEPARNYWFHWNDEMLIEKKFIRRPIRFGTILTSAINQRLAIPPFVAWTPNKWADFSPTLLPPALGQATNLPPVELCLDEYESACLTLSSLSDVPLAFDLQYLSTAPPPEVAARKDVTVLRVKVTVWPVRIPAQSHMETFLWNDLAADPQHVAFLHRMKANWFTVTFPKFTVKGQQLTCDFKDTDASLKNVKNFGKGMFIYSILMEFDRALETQVGIKRTDATYVPLLEQYFNQWLSHMKESGWSPEDYAIQLWDQPKLGSTLDQSWLGEHLARAAAIMKTIEPKVQIMFNPMLSFNQKAYDQLANLATILAPHADNLYLQANTRTNNWIQAQLLKGEDSKDSNLKLQTYLRKLNEERALRRWTFIQHEASVQNGIAYFRHFPWKSKWMELEGVSIWGSWYATGGALINPDYQGTPNWQEYSTKGLYGFREGVEDVQYLELLEDIIKPMEKANHPNARFLRDVFFKAQKRVANTGWYAATPEQLDEAITNARRELMAVLKSISIPRK